jgi:hypothetical protein
MSPNTRKHQIKEDINGILARKDIGRHYFKREQPKCHAEVSLVLRSFLSHLYERQEIYSENYADYIQYAQLALTAKSLFTAVVNSISSNAPMSR